MSFNSYASLIVEGFNNAKQSLRIRKEIQQQGIGLIYLDVMGLGVIEQTEGRSACDRILQMLKKVIVKIEEELAINLIALKTMGDDFYLFVQLPQSETVSAEQYIGEASHRIKDHLEICVNTSVNLNREVQLYVGTAVLLPSEQSYHKSMYNAMKQASNQAKHRMDMSEHMLSVEFASILESKRLRSHFQPIVSLVTGQPFGVEALLRGPADSYFTSPDNLFTYAKQADQLIPLEKMATESSLTTFGASQSTFKLFMNVDSRSFMDESFTLERLLSLTKQANISPHDVVIEITERSFVSDYKDFKRVLDQYRDCGFSVAVDDAGMGYSSLQAITELMPTYIKIDKSLIRYIDREMVKALMVETLVDFAKKINCTVIAEGIETEQELSKVIQLGVQFGQGYFLAKPAPAITFASPIAQSVILQGGTRQGLISPEKMSVGDLVHDAKVFQDSVRVSEVAHYFNQNESELCVVVVRGNRPVGLVMRDRLLRNLATQYGVPLYWNKEIRHLMDTSPLIVESTVGIDTASRLSMEREHEKVYDSLIVTSAGEFIGIVTIQDILSTINTIQIVHARDSNPLTGLPGNHRIEREIQRRIATDQPFYMIYADIDHFKWFNDQYGFHRGDQVIRFVADLLVDVCHTSGYAGSFVGHVGGDDFIVVTDNEYPELWCEHIIHSFDEGILNYYGSDADVQRIQDNIHSFTVYDRAGNPVPTDGLTLSLSLLQCPCNEGSALNLTQVTEEVSLLKKTAKERTGSTYVRGVLETKVKCGNKS